MMDNEIGKLMVVNKMVMDIVYLSGYFYYITKCIH